MTDKDPADAVREALPEMLATAMETEGGRVMLIGEKDFTIEAWFKKPRKVHRWRGRRFVVRNPWRHVAIVTARDEEGVMQETHYVDGAASMNWRRSCSNGSTRTAPEAGSMICANARRTQTWPRPS